MTVGSVREQIAWVRATQPADGRVVLVPPHVLYGEVEKVVTCVGCGAHIAVPVCVDPEGFVGVVCGCVDAGTLETLEATVEGEGTAGNGRKGVL